ncbi:MAG: hypothetical protein HY895_16755 [Deltaproteobacteria bacterium]|nr:hypothetical protein [Deltaproteobacteria bacterium]
MKARAAVWKINREVMESMLRDWFKKARCRDDAWDLRLLDVGCDGRHVVALVELIQPAIIEDRELKEYVDRLVKEA